jgi:two-component system, OmpR family, response regulator
VGRICRVLVVEDNGDIRTLLDDIFASEGYRFTAVPDGAAMRGALQRGDVDVVVVDMRLPDGNGLELAREAALQGCGVVLTTGHPGHMVEIAESGFQYVLKPFRIDSVLKAVDLALTEVRARCKVGEREFAS